MEPTGSTAGSDWRRGTVIELVQETRHVRSMVLELDRWTGHRAGQHVELRLTTSDGTEAQRSYWIASGPEDGYLVLTIERRPAGRVSPYLARELLVGDELELRGPLGDHFVWDEGMVVPVLLVAADVGIAPFRSMLRHRAALHSGAPVRLLYAARSLPEVIYHEELMRYAAYDEVDIRLTLTHAWPNGWRGDRGRIDHELLDKVCWRAEDHPLNFVCGPTHFVDEVTRALDACSQAAGRIRTERF
jgi:ferredoxin-NADP reductase